MAFEHLLAFSTPAGVALTDVFARCLKEVLNEYAYYADCAGLSYDVRVTKGGFELMFYGYHHKLPVLVQRVVDEMRRMASGDTPCPPELYARMKARQTQLPLSVAPPRLTLVACDCVLWLDCAGEGAPPAVQHVVPAAVLPRPFGHLERDGGASVEVRALVALTTPPRDTHGRSCPWSCPVCMISISTHHFALPFLSWPLLFVSSSQCGREVRGAVGRDVGGLPVVLRAAAAVPQGRGAGARQRHGAGGPRPHRLRARDTQGTCTYSNSCPTDPAPTGTVYGAIPTPFFLSPVQAIGSEI